MRYIRKVANQLIGPLDGAPLRKPGIFGLDAVTMLFHAVSYQIMMHRTLIQDDRRWLILLEGKLLYNHIPCCHFCFDVKPC